MEFRLFDRQDLDGTLSKWKAEAEAADFFPNEVEQRLAWVGDSLDAPAQQNHRELAYGVFQPGEKISIATCQLVLSDRGSLVGRWLKMLKVTLSPEIENAIRQDDAEAISLGVQAYKTAVLGSFAERLTHEADTLKLYGRSDEILRFLMVLLGIINEDSSSKLSARKEGRWLVIKALE